MEGGGTRQHEIREEINAGEKEQMLIKCGENGEKEQEWEGKNRKKNTKHKKGKNEELIQIFHDRNNKARQRKQRHVDKKKELFTGENRKRQKTPWLSYWQPTQRTRDTRKKK